MTASCEPPAGTPPDTLHLIQGDMPYPICALWKGGEHAEWIVPKYNGGMVLLRGLHLVAAGYRYIAPVPDPAAVERLVKAARALDRHMRVAAYRDGTGLRLGEAVPVYETFCAALAAFPPSTKETPDVV